MQGAVGLHHLAQRAVDAKAHAGVALIGLDMNIAGAVFGGLHQQGVEHADDGRVGRGFQQVFYCRQLLHHARQVGFAFYFTHHHGRTRLGTGVAGADALGQAGGVELLEMIHRIRAQNLAPRTCSRLLVVPQREAAPIVLEQQLVGARKRVGQGVAHGA